MTVGPSRSKTINPWWIAIVCGMASYIDACAIIGSGIALIIFYSTTNLVANTNGQFGTYMWVNVIGQGVGFAFRDGGVNEFDIEGQIEV